MPSVAIHTILGPLPLLRGLFRWSLAVLFAVGAWHLYLWSPLPGLVAIGITPVLAIFFFFRGLNLVSRTLPYWKTRRLIRKLGMHPTWWNTGAGYLLIDERQGSWIINGTAGMKRSAKLRKFSKRPMPHRKKETFPSHSRTYGKKKTKPPKRIENESFPMKTRSSL